MRKRILVAANLADYYIEVAFLCAAFCVGTQDLSLVASENVSSQFALILSDRSDIDKSFRYKFDLESGCRYAFVEETVLQFSQDLPGQSSYPVYL